MSVHAVVEERLHCRIVPENQRTHGAPTHAAGLVTLETAGEHDRAREEKRGT